MNKIIYPVALSCLVLSACGDSSNQAAPEATDTAAPMPAEELVAELPPAPVSMAPDCASPEARDALAQIAISNELNKLDIIMIFNALPGLTDLDSDENSRLYTNNVNRFFNVRSTAVYSLENVRTTAKDESLKNSTCAADFKMELEDFGWARVPITYKLETTSEGRLYATVNGIT